MVHRNLGLAALGLAVSTVASAQNQLPGQPFSSSPDALLADWTSEHGAGWHLQTHPLTGTLEMLHGMAAEGPFEPDTNQPEDWFALARYWVQETYAMHGIEDAQLVKPRFRYLPLAQANTTDKVTVRFEQVVEGVPVEQAAVNVLFDTQGRMLSLHTTAAPAVEKAGVRPLINAGFANLIAAEAFKREFGVEPTTQGNERLVHAWIDEGTRRWQFAGRSRPTSTGPKPIGIHGRSTPSAAASPAGLDIHNMMSSAPSAPPTPGTTSDSCRTRRFRSRCRGPASPAAGHDQIDRNGNFNCRRQLADRHHRRLLRSFDVQLSADYTITFQNVQPGQQNDLLANLNPTQNTTAEANAQIHLQRPGLIRERFPTIPPRIAPSRTSTSTRTATPSSTAAASSPHGRRWLREHGLSTVVAHEMGHWLNVRHGTGNVDGTARATQTSCDVPLRHADRGAGFTNGGSIRNGNNNRQFCGSTPAATARCTRTDRLDGRRLEDPPGYHLPGNDLGDLTSTCSSWADEQLQPDWDPLVIETGLR